MVGVAINLVSLSTAVNFATATFLINLEIDMHCNNTPILRDCPNCGSKQGAFMSCSAWCHSISCCSDKCGEEIQEKLLENEKKKKYKQIVKKIYKLKGKALDMRYKGINARDPFFEI